MTSVVSSQLERAEKQMQNFKPSCFVRSKVEQRDFLFEIGRVCLFFVVILHLSHLHGIQCFHFFSMFSNSIVSMFLESLCCFKIHVFRVRMGEKNSGRKTAGREATNTAGYVFF